jgi:hypothetical protein
VFGLFKKTNWKIEGKALSFFRHLFDALGTDYAFLSEGLRKGLYRKYSANYAFKDNAYTVWFDPAQSDQSIIKGKIFRLENILIIHNEKEYLINLTIDEGLWVGFECEKGILSFDAFKIDLSQLKRSKMKSSNNQLNQIVDGIYSDELDLSDLSEFEVDGKRYYQIKDLQDGNYLAIDIKGRVFGLMHDPFKIELINNSLRQFAIEVNSAQFDIKKYFQS